MSETAPVAVAVAATATGEDVTDSHVDKIARVDRIEMMLPDDWHMHFRDDERLPIVSNLSSKQFGRAIAMPNLIPPVVSTEQALAYRERILASQTGPHKVEPLMTLYLTDDTPPEEIIKAKASGLIVALKLYPAGATTNSSSGVTDLDKLEPTLRAMAENDILLLVHGEVTDPTVDLWDREKVFIDRHLRKLVRSVPELKVVMEHITTKDAVEFVRAEPNVAATITCHHLLHNRDALFKGGMRPHKYCLPVLKAETHRQALLEAVRSGEKCFFLGTDSAAHSKTKKECSCISAGCLTSHAALELYVQAFEEAGALDNLEAFACFNGPDFYGLPRNEGESNRVVLVREDWLVEETYPLPDGDVLVPINLGDTVPWKMIPRSPVA